MQQFPSDIHFKYPWRKYQKRVLDELETHLDDDHLHIIAPPGSGKTVLGLEVALRLNQPTLILAPTLAIRNQWIQRFCELFIQVNHTPDWISRNIKKPEFLTVVTYQSLHAACAGTEEEELPDEILEESLETKVDQKSAREVIERLQAQNIKTIVLDEAHHLKNAWWQSLIEVKKNLHPTIVGLTATPPYDVSYAEWQRYNELNGPVDAEITVPELVVEGDLCPHQDYVFFSSPTREETEKINAFRKRVCDLFESIKEDEELIEALEQHPVYQKPKENLDWIYSNIEYFSALLIFLNAAGQEISEEYLEIVGDVRFAIPELDYEWTERLLSFYLFNDPLNFKLYEEHQEKLAHKLKRNGVLERRSINFSHNRKLNGVLNTSINKLNSINQIVDFEHQALQQDLRMVVLTDYIRKEFLVNQPENKLDLNKIGVLPIFEKLRRNNHKSIKIGVLTGSLIIIPLSALPALREVAARYKVDELSTTPLSFDSQYLQVNLTARVKHDIVHIITQVFQNGHIEVLIGTKSLLGEGWDAPAVNSLILASFVGSYVLSNQMRGRAIRTDSQNVDKTGNIWHLVTIDPTAAEGGDDFQLLRRRFKAFVGVTQNEENGIENGMQRLDLPEILKSEEDIAQANALMLEQAGKRSQLKDRWQSALEKGTTLIEEIKVPYPANRSYRQVTSFYYNRTRKYLLGTLGAALSAFGVETFEDLIGSAFDFMTTQDVVEWLVYTSAVGSVTLGGLTYKTFKAYVKNRDIAKDFHQIGETLVRSLIKARAIETPVSQLKVVSEIDEDGAVYCHLDGGSTFEKTTFITSLQEILSEVNNPRYMIIRKGTFLNLITQRDYHAVPDLLGRKKKYAQYLKEQWANRVGACELVYLRTVEGRKLLLKARMNSLASAFNDISDRVSKWR